MNDPEMTNKVNDWRNKAAAGTLTQEEMIEAIKFLRAGRQSAAAQPKAASNKRPVKSSDDLLKELL